MHRHTLTRVLLCLALMLTLMSIASAGLTEKTATVTADLEIEDDVYQAPASTSFPMTIEVPKEGLTAVRMDFGDSVDYDYLNFWGYRWDTLLNEGVLTFGAWYQSGDYEVYLQAYYGEALWEDDADYEERYELLSKFDWDNSPDVIKSDVIKLHVTSKGKLTPAKATILNEGSRVARGDYVSVKVTDIDPKTEDVFACIVQDERGMASAIHVNDENISRLATGTMEPGEYEVWVYNQTEGYDRVVTKLPLTITEAAAGVTFTVNRTTIKSGDTLRISGYCEGAASYLLFDGESMHDWEPIRSRDGFIEEQWPDHAVVNAEYKLYAYDEEGSLIGVSDPVYVTVTADGDSTMPVISAPLVTAPGEDVKFTVTYNLPEGREMSWFDLSVNDPEWNNIFSYTLDDGELNGTHEFTIPGYRIGGEGNYTINLYLREYGMNSVNAKHTMISTVNKPDNERINLRVIKDGKDVHEVLTAEEVTIQVHAEGAKMVTLVANGELMECERLDDNDFVCRRSWWSDNITLLANATWDDPEGHIPWELTWFTSDPWELKVTSIGRVAPYDISVPETVALGEDLIITLPEGGIPNAYGVGVRVREEPFTDDELFSRYFYEGEDVKLESISIPTGELTPGKTYWVESWAGDKPGYDGRDTLRGEHSFTVVAPEGDGFSFIVSKTEGVNHEPLYVTAYAPGAASIEVFWNDEPWDRAWGSDAFRPVSDKQLLAEGQLLTGTNYIYGVAHYPNGSEERSEIIAVTATADPWPTPLTIESGDIRNGVWEWKEGGTVTISFNGLQLPMIEGTDGCPRHWHLNLWPEGEDNILSFNMWENRDRWHRLQDGKIVLTADELQPNKLYVISLDGHLQGYEDFREEFRFLVLDTDAENKITLTIDGHSDNATLTANENVHIQLDAEGATGWRFFSIDNWDFIAAGEDRWYGWNEGEYTFLAQATYDKLPGDMYDWGWDHYREVNWSKTSNIVKVTVTAQGNAQPGAYNVEDSYKRGEPIEITFAPGNHVQRYEVRLRNPYNQGYHEFFYTECDGQGGTVSIPTATMRPGSYIVSVNVIGKAGYNTIYDVNHDIQITEPDASGKVLMNIDRPIQQVDGKNYAYGINYENMRVTGYYPGAAFFRTFYRVDGSGNPRQFGQDWEANEFDAFRINLRLRSGDNELFTVAYDKNGKELARSDTLVTSVHDEGTLYVSINGLPCIDLTKDYTFFVDGLYGANFEWNVEVLQRDSSGRWEMVGDDLAWSWREEENDGSEWPSQFVIPANRLDANHEYRIFAFVASYGWNDGMAHLDLSIAETNPEKTVTLTVKDAETGKTEGLLANTPILTRIEAPGADAVMLIRPDRNETYTSLDDRLHRVGNGIWEVHDDWNSGEYTVTAAASYDKGHTWTAVSAPVTVNIGTIGELGEASIEVPADAVRGDLLYVKVHPAENAVTYHLRLRKMDGEEIDFESFNHDGTEVFEGYVATANAEPGTYYVTMDYVAAGYDWRGIGHDRQYRVEILEGEQGVAYLNLASDEYFTDEQIRASVFAEGAEKLRVNIDAADGQEWHREYAFDGESAVVDLEKDDWRTGEYRITLDVKYPGENWRNAFKSATVRLKQHGKMEMPTATFQHVVPLGKAVPVKIDAVEGTDFYKVVIEDALTGEWILNYDFPQPGTYQITSEMYNGGAALQPGKVYRISVSVWRFGYAPSWTDEEEPTYFAYADTNSVLTLPKAVTTLEDEAFAGVPAGVVVITNKAANIDLDAAFDGSGVCVAVAPAEAQVTGSKDSYVIVTPEEFAACTR